ncbi:MAG: Bax inhibitor-1/YccA family protein [Rothia sp. (in: high G+C Gram-positive bacteria)]|uniref:Bax inhibitor-1/YccA family protein n=1 Tax=Rothia sp. (in: high G+C Gram-positive bacteria) TaxID=1885016 RepID=UPI0026DEF917|nr:Bax inhibitor-1/YccA family protein [Rothia sp. (in: high G+C Gram-positive bacteria)]MDO5750261.1 Bax inhibitor-1/YccA family protein [Rothia sp. (in: high G+C Gram-positive bacteria)]
MAGNPLINSTVKKNRFGRFGAQGAGSAQPQGQQVPGFFGQGTYGAQGAQFAHQAQPGYAQGGYAQPGYEQYAPVNQGVIGERATMDDVIMKTGLTLAMVVLGAAVSWYMPILMYVGLLAGLILGIVNAVKAKPVPALVLLYGVAEGLFLGGFSGLVNQRYPGIALQAVLATVAVFAVMLFLFANGKVRATPKLNKIFFAATLGLLGYYLLSMGVGLFTGSSFNSFILPGTNLPLGLIVGLLGIALATYSLVIDFTTTAEAVEAGVPQVESWRLAYALTASLVWLYVEILRVLMYLYSMFSND